MVAEVLSQPIMLITILTFTAAIASIFIRSPEKIGDFSHSGKKGKILFVEDSAVKGSGLNVEQEQRSVKEMEDIKKELFLLDEEDNDDQNILNQIIHTLLYLKKI